MKTLLFISGTYRSGTTLVEKLLNMHPEILIGSQPTPLLFFLVKNAFLEKEKITKIYPIDHSFLEDQFSTLDFDQYLENTSFDVSFVREIINKSVDYDGMLTPGFPEFLLENISKADKTSYKFFVLYEMLLNALKKYLSPSSDFHIIGAKEILGEEYFQYLLDKGYKVLHIIRDPRDIISSLTNGSGRNFMGAFRPALYSLRMWRKSVAYAIHLSKSPNYFCLKYEDLVNDPQGILKNITSWLGTDDFKEDAFLTGIRDQFGNLWKGNSSYSNYGFISNESISKFKQNLSEDVIKYIETVCLPEMNILGYKPIFPIGPLENLATLISQERVEDKRFAVNYSFSDENILVEIDRLRYLLEGSLSEEKIKKWFIFSEPYHSLSSNLAGLGEIPKTNTSKDDAQV